MAIIKSKSFILLNLINIIFLLASCTPQAKISVYTPAEIDTQGIKKVAIGTFEIGTIYEKIKTEKDGIWSTQELHFSEKEKKSISRQVRAQIVNTISSNPYFDLVYTDEFEKLENNSDFQNLIAAGGYKSKNVDAVINGKIWIEFQKVDGADVAKAELLYVQGGRKKSGSVNLSVEKILWWPYKNMRGTLILESKLTHLKSGEILAITTDRRSFSHKIGGKPKDLLGKLEDATETFSNIFENEKSKNNKEIDQSEWIFPSFTQLTSELATSIATSFVRKVAVTQTLRSYPIAQGGDHQGKLLIQAGAYNMAIQVLQRVTNHKKDPDDLYNLALAFEAIGMYGVASNFYKEALAFDRKNLMYAQGLGRIERLLRERPQLRGQLMSK